MGRVQDTVNSVKSALKSVLAQETLPAPKVEPNTFENDVARCKKDFATAKAAHDANLALAEKAEAELAKAKAAFDSDPFTDGNGIAFFRAEKVLAMVREKVASTQGPFDRAVNALATAELALASRLEAEAKAARIAELQRRSSLEGFRTRNSLNYATILDAFDTIRRASLSIEADFNGVNQAAMELSELGEPTEQLEHHHQFMGLIEGIVDRDRDQLHPMVLSLTRSYGGGVLNRFHSNGLVATLCAPVEHIREPGSTNEADVPELLEKLEIFASHPQLRAASSRVDAISRLPRSNEEVHRFEQFEAERHARKAARLRSPADAPDLGAKSA